MKSHEYSFHSTDLFRLIGWPLVPVLAFVVAMQLAPRLNLLPTPRPTLDTDRTILVHQAESARSAHDAQILLIGDSSCLMDVNARQLGQELGVSALNLGTLSFLDLEQYAALLRRYAEANPGRLRAVVLLMNPEALRRVGAGEYYVQLLNDYWNGRDTCRTATLDDRLACWLGLDTFRGRVLSRALPAPLAGPFGRRYGFSDDLEAFMARENGSVIDPVFEQPKGRAEYRLSPTLKTASVQFRGAIPRGVKLLAGITPVPATVAGPDYPELRASMLREWASWLQAGAALESLPAMLSENNFARPTHLNESAVPRYTREVAEALRPHLR